MLYLLSSYDYWVLAPRLPSSWWQKCVGLVLHPKEHHLLSPRVLISHQVPYKLRLKNKRTNNITGAFHTQTASTWTPQLPPRSALHAAQPLFRASHKPEWLSRADRGQRKDKPCTPQTKCASHKHRESGVTDAQRRPQPQLTVILATKTNWQHEAQEMSLDRNKRRTTKRKPLSKHNPHTGSVPRGGRTAAPKKKNEEQRCWEICQSRRLSQHGREKTKLHFWFQGPIPNTGTLLLCWLCLWWNFKILFSFLCLALFAF